MDEEGGVGRFVVGDSYYAITVGFSVFGCVGVRSFGIHILDGASYIQEGYCLGTVRI